MASPTPTPVYVPRRRSMMGPLIMIGLGVVFLLVNTGTLSGKAVFIGLAKYWPLLIILIGLEKLWDYWDAQRKGLPAPGLGAGTIFFLIFLILLGSSMTGAYKFGNRFGDIVEIDGEEFPIFFGGQKFEYPGSLAEQTLPTGGSVKVTSDRGDITVLPSSDDKVHVTYRTVVYGENDGEARAKSQKASVKAGIVDKMLLIEVQRPSDWNAGAIHVEILAPKKAAVDLMTVRGDITVRDREGEVRNYTSKGGVKVEAITGDVTTHLRSGDFEARGIKGDVRLEGRVSDVNVNAVTGFLDLQGEYFGTTQVEKVAKGVRFKSSRTELDMARLDGSMDMDSGDLRIQGLTGPFRVETRSKDIRLEDVVGDVKVTNSNGAVEISSKLPVGNMDVENRNGSIRVTVPTQGSFVVDARSERGEVDTDLGLQKNDENRVATLSGTVGKGGPRLSLRTKNGEIGVFSTNSARAMGEMDTPRAPRSPDEVGDKLDRAMDKVDKKLDEAGKKVDKAMKKVDDSLNNKK
ncbi:MAG: DUF4097 family beta strand repeat protein [Acidobacteriales bacterium]|nr:DUF4097 family beta strand repeat protein [Terriglobales bacterium]